MKYSLMHEDADRMSVIVARVGESTEEAIDLNSDKDSQLRALVETMS